MYSIEIDSLKIRIATEIYNGINDIDVNLNIEYTSKRLELLPLISKINELKSLNNVTVQQIALSLREDEIKSFSKIHNLKEKVRLICSV